MKKNADDFYFFILPMKYGSETLNIKTARTIILTAVVCYPLMYLIIENFKTDGTYLPESLFFKGVATFFLIFVCLSLLSFAFHKYDFYDSLVWLLASFAFLEISYFLIIMEWLAFLRKHISIDSAALIFNTILSLPIIFVILSFVRYTKMIQSGKTKKNSTNVILLEKKFNNSNSKSMEYFKKNRFILGAAFIGVSLAGILETSFTLFVIFLACSCFISWIMPRFFFISYAKFKFPTRY